MWITCWREPKSVLRRRIVQLNCTSSLYWHWSSCKVRNECWLYCHSKQRHAHKLHANEQNLVYVYFACKAKLIVLGEQLLTFSLRGCSVAKNKIFKQDRKKYSSLWYIKYNIKTNNNIEVCCVSTYARLAISRQFTAGDFTSVRTWYRFCVLSPKSYYLRFHFKIVLEITCAWWRRQRQMMK